jgi:hypothetical protein
MRSIDSAGGTCLVKGARLTMSFILGMFIIALLVGFSPLQFCAGFERGYTVGYQRTTGVHHPATPACPASVYKSRGNAMSGYLIGLVQGMVDGRRKLDFAAHTQSQ